MATLLDDELITDQVVEGDKLPEGGMWYVNK